MARAGPGGRRPAGGPSTRDRVAEVFAQPGFRRFFATRAVSQFGDGVFQLAAAAVLLFEDPGDNPAFALATLTAVVLIPFSVVSPLAGVFIDRWERQKILVRTPLLRAAVALLAPLAAAAGTHGVAYYVVVLFVLSANRFFLSTLSAVLPQLVPEDDLIVANSAATIGGSISNVVGQGVGAALAAAFGGEQAGIYAALAFAASAVVARRFAVHRGFVPQRGPLGEQIRDVVAEMVEGVRRVRASARASFGITAITFVQVLVGALTGVLVHYFIVVLEVTVSSAVGVLAVLAIGIGAGVALVPLATRRLRHDLLIPASLAIAGLGALVPATGLTRTRILAGTVVIGISYAFVKIPVDVIVQEEMADRFRGRAFAVYDMLFNAARVGGVALVAVAYEAGVSSNTIITVSGAAYFAGSVWFSAWEWRLAMGSSLIRRLFGRTRRPEARPEDLLVPGEVVHVRAYAGGRADEEPRVLVIGGRELPITAIDWRAVVEEGGRRRRAFVVQVAGRRVRLSIDDNSTWEIERVMSLPPAAPD